MCIYIHIHIHIHNESHIDMHTLLYLKQITNNSLYITGNYAQYCLKISMGKRFEKEKILVYV